jgi:integral membrane protein
MPSRTFHRVAIAEAISFLCLLGIAMPLKYAFGQPLAVKIFGWVHGALFIAYVITANKAAEAEAWPGKRLLLAYLAAVLPAGPFFFEHHFSRK